MIVIQDLSEETAKKMEQKLKGIFRCIVEAGAPYCVRAHLDDEATILYKSRGEFVVIEYEHKQYQLFLNEFATMEIL